MEERFQEWLSRRNAGWYLLSEKQMEWYVNEWLNEIEENRKEEE